MSRCSKQFFWGIALFLFLILAAPLPVWSQNTAVVLQVAPSTAEIGVDEIIDVAVEVRDVSALYGFDITVGYDPAVVEVVDFDPDLEGIQVALGLFLDPGFVIFNQADNSLGQLRLVMTQLNPSQPKSGSGNLLVIRFRALQAGQTPLLLLAGELAQPDGTSFFPQLVDGQLTAVTTTLPQPSNTPIPTRLAGTPLPTTTPVLPLATATPQMTQAATVSPPTVTPPPPTPTPQPASPTPTVFSQATLPISAASTPAGTALSAADDQTTVTPVVLAAQLGNMTRQTEAQDTQETAAAPAPGVAVVAAETAVPEISLTIVGSGVDANGADPKAADAVPAENSSQSLGLKVFLLISGLLLVIGAFFFFMSRKRQPGD